MSSDGETDEQLVKVLWATDDSYGFTRGKSHADKLRNYERKMSFRLKPIAFVSDENIPSIEYLVKYFISKREVRLTIPDTDKNDFKAVCAKLMNRYPDELAEGSLSQIDFKKIQVKHFNLWSEKAYVRKLPVRYIGLQRHLLKKFSDWTPDKMEFFFSEEHGVLGINGHTKLNAKTVYVKELMKGVPKMECSFSGFQGFAKHLEPPYTSNQGGDIYFESVNCSANIAMMTFHAAWFREKFGKLGMVCIAGPPNIAKTNSLKVAMHMASSLNYFFSMKTTPELIQAVCEKVGLLISYDDNDSLRKEEVLGVSRFDGGIIGSKGQGIKHMVGEIVLTSNDVNKRSEKMKLGRVFVLRKMFPGFAEGDNMLEALVNLAELTDALTDECKPLDFLVTTTSLWFKTVEVPESASKQLKGNQASQMLIWFAQTCQIIRDLTGNSLREIFTIAALNMWSLFYDVILPPDSEWWKNGGSLAYFRTGGYFHMLLIAEADVYGQPLQNPGSSVEERFKTFITQILDEIDTRLGEVRDPKMPESPGDFVAEVRLVWSKIAPSKEKDLCLALVRSVNYREVFGTDDEITAFIEFVKQQGGNAAFKISTEYLGKQTHSAVAIGLKYFEQVSQKRLIKTLVRSRIKNQCKTYGSIRSKRRVEERRRATDSDSDYNDTEVDDTAVRSIRPATTNAKEPQIAPNPVISEVILPAITGLGETSNAATEEQTTTNTVQEATTGQIVLPGTAGSRTTEQLNTAVPSTIPVDQDGQASQVATNQHAPSQSQSSAQTSPLPSSQPSPQPSAQPSTQSSAQPSTQSSAQPTSLPSAQSVSNLSSNGLLDFLFTMPSIDVHDEVFDPENLDGDISGEETDSDDGQSLFRNKAFSAAKDSPVQMVRTRSQTSSKYLDIVGKIVFAHKGKSIPCWFPGKVLQKTSKGYEIEFLAQFGTEVCVEKNVMIEEEYIRKKNDSSSSSLFRVPAKHKSSFEAAMKQASEASK